MASGAATLVLTLAALFGEALGAHTALRHASKAGHALLTTDSHLSTNNTWTAELSSLVTRFSDINTWLFDTAGADGSIKVHAPPAKSGEYFRPVSTTVQCVMALTIVSVLFHTALSLSRNVDELSGEFKPSTITRTLTAAHRGTSLAPMLCMLFVGCRMFVLATTEGLGEPPQWAKNCMYAASAGMCLQFCIVCLLRVPAKQDEEQDDDPDYDMTEGKLTAAKAAKEAAAAASTATPSAATPAENPGETPAETPAPEADAADEEEDDTPMEDFDKATGEHNDAHPVLKGIKLKKEASALKPVFYGAQVFSMIAVYGGVVGVLLCIITFPAQTTQVSPAVQCTCWLTGLYFLSYLMLWACRELPDSDTNSKLLHAALSMSSVVRKAPMFAVFFLLSRMRALQLDPPHGMPPPWMQAVFFTMTALIYVETIAAAVVGYTGKKAKAYYGVYIFHCDNSVPHIIQHGCAFLTYVALCIIMWGATMMKGSQGQWLPLSTTFKCVVNLERVYFGIMFGQTLVFFIEDITKTEMPLSQDTFVAAGISMNFAPLLCILFVATRMRALQITQQMGAPPGWAQDCMILCVFATFIQAVCCLVMPIFVGTAAHVDDDGNPDYDTRPMIIAYAVTCVKYVALLCLHGGLMAICTAVFVMTPETANSSGRFMEGGKALYKGLAMFLGIFLIALLFSSAKVIGMAVKLGIESCDRVFLGVDITIKHCALGICKGYICIKDLKVHQPDKEIIYERDEKGALKANPTGNDLEWKNDYILKIKTVILKINLGRLITTLGKEFELENLSFSGIHANIEKPSTDMKVQDSNIDYLLNHIDSLGLVPAEEELTPEEAKKREEEAKKKAEEDAQKAKEDAEKAKEEAQKAKEEAEAKKAAGIKEEEAFVPKVILRKIEFGDIGAGVCISKVPVVGTLSFHPRIGKIVFDDIQRDIFNDREDLTPQETVACIVKALGKKIAKVVVKEIPAAIASKSKEAAKKAMGKSVEGMKKMGSKMKGMFTRKKTTDVDSSPTASGAEETEAAK